LIISFAIFNFDFVNIFGHSSNRKKVKGSKKGSHIAQHHTFKMHFAPTTTTTTTTSTSAATKETRKRSLLSHIHTHTQTLSTHQANKINQDTFCLRSPLL
jgi:hypothetical protein